MDGETEMDGVEECDVERESESVVEEERERDCVTDAVGEIEEENDTVVLLVPL